MTPSGNIVQGFSVTIGGITDPSMIQQRYDDITRILRANAKDIQVTEERDSSGHFRKFVVQA